MLLPKSYDTTRMWIYLVTHIIILAAIGFASYEGCEIDRVAIVSPLGEFLYRIMFWCSQRGEF
jgi:hypothetical protein